MPAPTEAEGFEDPLPYFLLGNKIFPHKTWLMRPFPGSLDDSQKISITDFPGLGKQSQMHLVFWQQDDGFLNNQYGLPLKLFSQSLGLVFVFTTIYKQRNHRLIHRKVSQRLKDLMERSRGEWRNIIKHDKALNSFTKTKRGKLSYDAKVVQSSLKAYLNSVVG